VRAFAIAASFFVTTQRSPFRCSLPDFLSAFRVGRFSNFLSFAHVCSRVLRSPLNFFSTTLSSEVFQASSFCLFLCTTYTIFCEVSLGCGSTLQSFVSLLCVGGVCGILLACDTMASLPGSQLLLVVMGRIQERVNF